MTNKAKQAKFNKIAHQYAQKNKISLDEAKIRHLSEKFGKFTSQNIKDRIQELYENEELRLRYQHNRKTN